MIQDFSPYRLDMAYSDMVPATDDCFFSFRGEDVLLRDMGGRAQDPPVLPGFRASGRRNRKQGGIPITVFLCLKVTTTYSGYDEALICHISLL